MRDLGRTDRHGGDRRFGAVPRPVRGDGDHRLRGEPRAGPEARGPGRNRRRRDPLQPAGPGVRSVDLRGDLDRRAVVVRRLRGGAGHDTDPSAPPDALRGAAPDGDARLHGDRTAPLPDDAVSRGGCETARRPVGTHEHLRVRNPSGVGGLDPVATPPWCEPLPRHRTGWLHDRRRKRDLGHRPIRHALHARPRRLASVHPERLPTSAPRVPRGRSRRVRGRAPIPSQRRGAGLHAVAKPRAIWSASIGPVSKPTHRSRRARRAAAPVLRGGERARASHLLRAALGARPLSGRGTRRPLPGRARYFDEDYAGFKAGYEAFIDRVVASGNGTRIWQGRSPIE